MGQQIRELMLVQEATDLQGVVKVDEAPLGGVARGGKRGWGAANKTCLLGMIEREGQVLVIPMEKRNGATILPLVQEHVQPGTVVNTDEVQVYEKLPGLGYAHQTVVHSKYQWAQGEAHTNLIAGYWSNLKKSVRSTYTSSAQSTCRSIWPSLTSGIITDCNRRGCSRKYLQESECLNVAELPF